MKIKYFVLLLLVGALWGQEPKKVSLVVQNKILVAEHKFDQATTTKLQAEAQFQELKAIYANADKQAQVASKEVNEAIEEAWKESGLDRNKYTFDPANFTFPLKPKPEVKK